MGRAQTGAKSTVGRGLVPKNSCSSRSLFFTDGRGNSARLKSRVPGPAHYNSNSTMPRGDEPSFAPIAAYQGPRGTKGPGRGSFENIKEVDLGWGPSCDDEGGREEEGGMRARPRRRARGGTARPAPAGSAAAPACDSGDPPPATPPVKLHSAACVPTRVPIPLAAPRGGGHCLGKTPASRSIQGVLSTTGPCRGPCRRDHER